MRNVYSMGLQMTTHRAGRRQQHVPRFPDRQWRQRHRDTRTARLHLDDPQVKEAVIKSLTYITDAYKDGYVPPGALSWNDADDNNAFHSKLIS